MPLVFEIGKEGTPGFGFAPQDVPELDIKSLLGGEPARKQAPALPSLSEPEAVRHYTKLSNRNFGVDANFYPLGSCTMKYNPKINEDVASMPGFARVHPLQPEETLQGALAVMYELDLALREISGMDRVSLQPSAGAHGEFTGLLIAKAYHHDRGKNPMNVLVPDTSHGTNPASAAMAGFKVVQVKSNPAGRVDMDDLKSKVNSDTAVFMLTNPNTLGLFEPEMKKTADLVHGAGGLVYYDGANLNAIMGTARPGDMGADVMHFNLHKTFSTPHGGGGPGSGPVGVKKFLEGFLPVPLVDDKDGKYYLDYDVNKSIGKVRSFFGSFNVMLKALVYIKTLGGEGLKSATEHAVLSANYLKEKLKEYYDLPYPGPCKHEFVLSADRQKKHGVSALDIAKRLIDYGIHPPTIYFPLIVHEAIMIEPTETESRRTLDEFVEVMIKIAKEAETDPDLLHNAPTKGFVRRLDEVSAARYPKLRYKK
mgnify:CR=1 FL=1